MAQNKKKLKPRTPPHKMVQGECVIPGAMPPGSLGQFVVKGAATQEKAVRAYVEWQARDEKVKHLEKVASESIFGQPVDAWDVRTNKNRWWVITNPTNLYSQELFPSLDYTLSFHVGVTTRMVQADMTKEQTETHHRINQLWNKLARARFTLFEARRVEDYQSVGMKCRECLLLLSVKLAKPKMVPVGQDVPQRGNFIGWCELIANDIAAGSSNDRLRSYLKAIAPCTWQLANWLTHSQSANNVDAAITCDATENVIQAYVLAAARRTKLSRRKK
jgi:hypothetical protein